MINHLAKLIHDDEGSSSIKKILIVDDELDFCEAIGNFLGAKGYSVLEAHDGDQALEVYRLERPDIVLLDMMMPGMSGLVALREFKALDPEVRVMMVTALHEEELAKQALAEGALDWITKPINPDDLEFALMRIIAMHVGDE